MFVLANRPGFPFLGNDFFGALGDLFGCHAIDNPACAHSNLMLPQKLQDRNSIDSVQVSGLYWAKTRYIFQ